MKKASLVILIVFTVVCSEVHTQKNEILIFPDANGTDHARSQLAGVNDSSAFFRGNEIITLAKNSSTMYLIFVDEDASQAEHYAANTLAEHLKKITKATFTVVNVFPKAPVIAVGPAAAAATIASSVPDIAVLGHDGIVIRTVGSNLLLTGAPSSRRGTIYAVMTFLEHIGCRWWTDNESYIPSMNTLSIPQYSEKYRPIFDMRDVHSYFLNNFAVYNKLNGNEYKIPEERGGTVEYKGPAFVHTFGKIVSCKEYASSHPEWFAEINGKRQFGSWDGKSSGHVPNSQLCMSTNHSDLIELIVGKVREYLRDAPPDSIVSLSQNDGIGQCQCSECMAVEREEGSPSGSILRFVNMIASAIENDYPQAKIDTLAYVYSEKPPAVTRPRQNVVIRLCAWNGTDNCSPYDKKPNERFHTALTGWYKIAPMIHVWDYTTAFDNYHRIFPNLFATCYNMRFFSSHHVTSILLQSSHNIRAGDMTDLKHWVYAKMLWNPQYDEKALIREFIEGYYMAGAPYVQHYIDRLYVDDPQLQRYAAPDFIADAYALYAKGKSLVTNDAVLLRRFERAFVSVILAVARYWTAVSPLLTVSPASRAAAADEYVRICSENGITYANELRVSPVKFVEQFRIEKKAVPLPAAFAHISVAERVDYQEESFRLWRPGERVFVVHDDDASDGCAASMPSTHQDWAVQLDLPGLPADGIGKWKVYASVKVLKKGNAGVAFSTGIYDKNERSGGSTHVTVSDITNDAYQFYTVGTSTPGRKYIWLSPAINPQNVREVRIDRILLVRER